MSGILYVVATPIGNLRDISLRALDVLRAVDVILAEDTRVTRKLLTHHSISTQVKRYNEHAPQRVYEDVLKRLRNGERIALVSDAGTPGISDPGAQLVGRVRAELPETHIEAVPGPSAVIAALSVSGISANEFTFLGYPPAKRKRAKFFEKLASILIRPVVLYESPHRLQKTLEGLIDVLGADEHIFIARELTKMYEEHFTGTLTEAQEHFINKHGKGEFVLILP